MDSIEKVINIQDDQTKLQFLYMRLDVMALADKPTDTIQLAKKILSLHKAHCGRLDKEDVADVKFTQAEAFCACGRWKEASKMYQFLCTESLQERGKVDIRFVMGLSRAKYETREYGEAIKQGRIALDTSRNLPGVHKYIALSQRELGKIEDARQTISRAILYEHHWDKENLKENRKILRELNSL